MHDMLKWLEAKLAGWHKALETRTAAAQARQRHRVLRDLSWVKPRADSEPTPEPCPLPATVEPAAPVLVEGPPSLNDLLAKLEVHKANWTVDDLTALVFKAMADRGCPPHILKAARVVWCLDDQQRPTLYMLWHDNVS